MSHEGFVSHWAVTRFGGIAVASLHTANGPMTEFIGHFRCPYFHASIHRVGASAPSHDARPLNRPALFREGRTHPKGESVALPNIPRSS